MHGRFSRRDLLKAASGTIALGLAGSLIASEGNDKARAALDRVLLSPAFPEYTDARLRELAAEALQAARNEGAQFADVRLELTRYLSFQCTGGVSHTYIDTLGIGVRAAIDGALGFAGGPGMTVDKVRALAVLATQRAKAARGSHSRRLEFAPAPVVRDGNWETPIEIDPFTVPVREQDERLMAAVSAAKQLKVSGSSLKYVHAFTTWVNTRRVFASTEGSFIRQRTRGGFTTAGVTAISADDDTSSVIVPVDTRVLPDGGYGYEAVSRVNLAEELRRAAEEGLRLAATPVRSVDVGRYDLVLDTEAMASLLVASIGRALTLDRARGDHADGAGTSYATPPMDAIGKYQVGGEILHVTADRSRPKSCMTVGWDEEGVKPEDFTLVKDGVIADFATSRDTASTMREWYARQQKPLRSHGCVTRTGTWLPILQVPNLTLQPAKASIAAQDLIRDVKRGFYVVRAQGGLDQQCLNGQYAGSLVHEIRNGKLAGRVSDMAFQFSTPQLWKSLSALGGPGSSSLHHVVLDGAESTFLGPSVLVVPGRFKQINVVNTGKQA